jgi:hypothetical protein
MAALLNFLIALFMPREQRDLAPLLMTRKQKQRRQRSLEAGHLADAGDTD